MKKIDNTPDETAVRGLLSVEIGSIAVGYRVLSQIAASDEMRILEASPAGPRFFILALGSTDVLNAALEAVRTELKDMPDLWVDCELLTTGFESVLQALYALPQQRLEEALVVIEFATISGALEAAQTLVSGHGLQPIEMRVQRTSSGGAYGFLTGPVGRCRAGAESVRLYLHSQNTGREGRVEVIEAPAKTFRSYFDFSGEHGN